MWLGCWLAGWTVAGSPPNRQAGKRRHKQANTATRKQALREKKQTNKPADRDRDSGGNREETETETERDTGTDTDNADKQTKTVHQTGCEPHCLVAYLLEVRLGGWVVGLLACLPACLSVCPASVCLFVCLFDSFFAGCESCVAAWAASERLGRWLFGWVVG